MALLSQVRWPDIHTFFAFFIEPAGCGSTVWEPRHWASVTLAPPGGWKKVGEVPCRDSQTFSALANTTGKGKESYGSSVTLARRFRRREETWDSLPRREGSGFRVVF